MKPIFIPLKREYYNAFKSGHKQIEYRRVGGQFTKANCTPGREVTLSLGYGSRNRIKGTVLRSWIEHHEHPTGPIADCYGTEPIDILAIQILVDRDCSYRARCGSRFTAERWFSYLTRTKVLGKCKVVRKGMAIVIEGLTKTQRQLLDCITWIVGPTDKDVDRARQLAGIPIIVQPVIPGLESWAQPREAWAC